MERAALLACRTMDSRALPVAFLAMAALTACLVIATSETLWVKRQQADLSKSQILVFKERSK
ncbi:hypothetical protein L0666_04605 [Octadecabacter sp. CECT 8868]|uniref:hypothetical protein n=1 Tax=Octadecabacter algicola TaxID=2909342 RepID=UPI001F48826E|nr:hypothetical protein [Octadecabacter algicola]MCF2904257.1 hypothetical protein [Octadecabacter algicola]